MATTPAQHVARLELLIDGDRYSVIPVDGGWRLKRHGSRAAYLVGLGPPPSCTCTDYLRRRQPAGERCKHLGALHAVQLI